MTGLLLSRRHRSTWTYNCVVCGNRGKIHAPFEFTTPTSTGPVRERVGICVGCLREGVKVATEGREVRRK